MLSAESSLQSISFLAILSDGVKNFPRIVEKFPRALAGRAFTIQSACIRIICVSRRWQPKKKAGNGEPFPAQ